MNFKIGTWNISEGVTAEWNLTDGVTNNGTYVETDLIKQITKKINESDVDIICFQEFPVEINNKELLKDKIYSETKLKYSVMYDTYPSFLFDGGKIGVCLFSKFPITYEEKHLFFNPDLTKVSKSGKINHSFDKGIILAKLELPEDELTIITGHAIRFRPFDKEAEDYPESYKPLSDLILNNISNKLIALGDFNTTDLFSLLPNIKDKVVDNVNGSTTIDNFESGKAGRKLDYILTTPNISVINVEKINNLSDHYLCVAEINI